MAIALRARSLLATSVPCELGVRGKRFVNDLTCYLCVRHVPLMLKQVPTIVNM